MFFLEVIYIFNAKTMGNFESLKKSKSLKKSDKAGKVRFDLLLDFWQKSTSLWRCPEC